MLLSQKNISVSLFLFLTFLCAELVTAQPQRAYERGLEAVHRGNITQALDEWYRAYEQEGGVDSRIGLEFIRVVTEENMEEYFGHATRLYYRALLDGVGMTSRVAIRQEIERMKPLIGDGIYRQWRAWWEENSAELVSDMRGFWVQLDPTPAKTANERLIEHWERIATAKQRFTRNGKTIYGTDERALIYIRYGEPDRTESGILTLQSFNIGPWLANQLRMKRETGSELPEQFEDLDMAQMGRLENSIYQFHQYPEFEVWFYDRLAPGAEEPIPFIFGTDINTDEFTHLDSVEDFIPQRAYYPERIEEEDNLEFTRAGITPALILQLLYYEQLIDVDPFFRTRLETLQNNILEQGLPAFQGMDLTFANESRNLIQQRMTRTPKQRSTYIQRLPEIPIEIHHYRFLNEMMHPYLITYVESYPQEAFLIDYYRNRDRVETELALEPGLNISEVMADYQLVHHLQTYDNQWETVENRHKQTPVILARTARTSVSTTMFRQPQPVRANQSASVELLNYNPDTKSVYATPFPPELRGLNRIQFRQPEPLENIPDSLEMADLVLGYQSENMVTEPFPFLVANKGVVPSDKTLMLHFEVYNLKRQENGLTRFELTYRILPVDESGQVDEDQTEFILTLNFINEEQMVVEDLEIETADLQPGLYELRVHVQDTETGRVKERRTRFEVEEN